MSTIATLSAVQVVIAWKFSNALKDVQVVASIILDEKLKINLNVDIALSAELLAKLTK